MKEDDNQPLPLELGWDNMKDGIFDKIQSIEEEQSSQRNNKYSRKRLGLLLILFFALTLGLFLVAQKMIKDQSQDHIVYDPVQFSDTEIEVYKRISNNSSNTIPTNHMGHAKAPLVEKNGNLAINDFPLTSKDSASNQDPKESESDQINIDQLPEQQYLKENDFLSNQSGTSFSGPIQSMLDTTQNALVSITKTKRPNLKRQSQALVALPNYRVDRINTETEQIQYPIPDIQKMDEVFFRFEKPLKPSNQLILEGGIIFWEEGYSKNKPERAAYETTLPSFQLQGFYVKNFKGNYFAMAGFQYQQLESRFQYNTTIQNYSITLKDTIIQVQNDLLTGEQYIIRGDIEQFVQAEHKIRHYNKTKLFKTSLAAGKTWRFNSFQTDVYLGGAINSLVQNQGRLLHQDSVINYNGSSNSIFKNQWAIDGFLGVRLHYLLNHRIAITTNFQAQKSLMNWSNQDNINFRPVALSLQLGFSYSL